MYKKAMSLWEEMTTEHRFMYLLDLDKKYRGSGGIGNGLLVLSRALIRKVEQVDTLGSNEQKGHG